MQGKLCLNNEGTSAMLDLGATAQASGWHLVFIPANRRGKILLFKNGNYFLRDETELYQILTVACGTHFHLSADFASAGKAWDGINACLADPENHGLLLLILGVDGGQVLASIDGQPIGSETPDFKKLTTTDLVLAAIKRRDDSIGS